MNFLSVEQYNKLAYVYDYLVQGVDFEEWIEYIEKIILNKGANVKNIADIACGTGNTIIPFASRGYKTAGVDLSLQMLTRAREKTKNKGLSINFYQQDMTELNLPEFYDLITCFHDGVNYLINLNDLKKFFLRVYYHLSKNGMFIFDLNTVSWLSKTSNDTSYLDEPDLTIIWDTSYNHGNNTWHINMLGFLKEENHYIKFKESHMERAYSNLEIKTALNESGLQLLNVFDAFTFSSPELNSIRHFYIAVKK
ncbi:MAG: class I SAM-dependent methyltransferase [Clostridiales bacterium]|nr:class I SAM-dependent methyltransferase [Clostridiales bacterium]MCF8021975.1 class I SAM-dependent methyltransferase [Clostridiales bacterium]